MRPLRKRPSAGSNQSGVLNPPCYDGDPRTRCMSTDPEARVAALTLHSMTLQVDTPRGACGPSAAARRGWYARTRRRRHALGVRCVATTILHRPGSWRARRTPRPRRGSEGDPVRRARIVALASTTHSHHRTRVESLFRVPCRRLNGDAACRRRPRPAPRGRSDDARPAALQRPEPPPTSGPTAVSRARRARAEPRGDRAARAGLERWGREMTRALHQETGSPPPRDVTVAARAGSRTAQEPHPLVGAADRRRAVARRRRQGRELALGLPLVLLARRRARRLRPRAGARVAIAARGRRWCRPPSCGFRRVSRRSAERTAHRARSRR